MCFMTYFDPFSGTMIEDIGDDDVFVAERDMKIPEGKLAKKYFYSSPFFIVSQTGPCSLSWEHSLGTIGIHLETIDFNLET